MFCLERSTGCATIWPRPANGASPPPRKKRKIDQRQLSSRGSNAELYAGDCPPSTPNGRDSPQESRSAVDRGLRALPSRSSARLTSQVSHTLTVFRLLFLTQRS